MQREWLRVSVAQAHGTKQGVEMPRQLALQLVSRGWA